MKPTLNLASPVLRHVFFAATRGEIAASGDRASANDHPPAFPIVMLPKDFFAGGRTSGDLIHNDRIDVRAGPDRFEATDFIQRHELRAQPSPIDPRRYPDRFFTFTHDFNGEVWLNGLPLGFSGQTTLWLDPAIEGGAQAHGATNAPELYAFLLRRSPDGRAWFDATLIDDLPGVGPQLVADHSNPHRQLELISFNRVAMP